jgi:polysaccharide export outer membrane protein
MALLNMSRTRQMILAGLLMGLTMLLPRPASAQTLGPGAKIHVTLAGEADVTGDYTVDAAGDIQMLYVNSVHVGGLTTPEAARKLETAQVLGRYFVRPQVAVTLVTPGGIAVVITGAVTTQGPGVARTDSRLNDIIQQAIPAVDADLSKIQVTHGIPGGAHTTDNVNYLAFLDKQDAAGNPTLLDGDVIFVPRKDNVQIQVMVRGEVAKPGRVSLPASATIYDAIQAAGGLLDDADRAAISLQATGAAPPTVVDFDTAMRQQASLQANPALHDGDTIVVKASATPNVYTIGGAVQKPGEFPLTTPGYSLADALGRAGGTADRAKVKQMTIVRRLPSGHSQVLHLDGSDPAVLGNTILQPGDNISVPQGSPPGNHYDPLQVLGVFGGLFGAFHR